MKPELGTIPFGPYAPDQPALNHPGLEAAQNAVPRATGYDYLNEVTEYSTNALDSAAKGALAPRSEAGIRYLYAGDEGKLYSMASFAFTDVSKASNSYAGTTFWDMVQIDNQVVATGFEDYPQVITMGSSAFADLTTDLKARCCAEIAGFLVFGNIDDVDGETPHRVRWSGYKDFDTYTPSPVTQAGLRDLGGSEILRIFGNADPKEGEPDGIIFQRTQTVMVTYIGPPQIFRFTVLEDDVGLVGPRAACKFGGEIFFLANDGPRVQPKSGLSRAIGEEVLDITLFSDLDDNHLERVTCAPRVKGLPLVYWAYPGPANVNGRPNRLMVYNHAVGRWSCCAEQEHEHLFVGATPFVGLDDMDALFSTLDSASGLVDDSAYSGGLQQIASFTPNDKLGFFTGAAADAMFETGEFELSPGRKTRLSHVRPLVSNADTVTVEVGHRDSLQDLVAWTTPRAPAERSGLVPHRVNARYIRFRLRTTGAFERALGVKPVASAGARR